MLAFIASRIPGPVVETADRDPGILTFAFTLVRALRHRAAVAFARRSVIARDAGGPDPF